MSSTSTIWNTNHASPEDGSMEKELELAVARGELKRIKLMAIMLALSLVLMGINFFVLQETTTFFEYFVTPYFVMGWLALFLGYEVIGFFIANGFLKRQVVVPFSLKFLSTTAEALLPSALLFFLCFLEESVIFLDSPIIFFYFILIVLSSLNMDLRLGLTTAILSVGGYLFISIWAINAYDPQQTVLDYHPVFYYARSGFMLLAALGAVFVAHEFNKRVRASFRTAHQKREIELLLGQQVSKEVMDALLENNTTSEKREVTIMFLDIRKFSAFAESRDPEEIIDFQNRIFSPIMSIVHRYNGITNQVLGDGIMATFGAPMADHNHPENAYSAALEMLETIEQLAKDGHIQPTRIGIGMHTGPVVVGNIGNEIRKQYSVSGTTVNIAARMEQLNKEHGTQCLISGALREKLHHSYEFDDLGDVQVRNISRPIKVFKVA
ncbi:MAG: adenylate/guanylate cyclase domain-containing protein [Bacteroidota bacterium]